MFVPWHKIESFYNLRRTLLKYPNLLCGTNEVLYRSKVKLHGTNAAVRIHSDRTVQAQSRSQNISIFKDNLGFAKWVAEREDEFLKLSVSYKDTIIFGEWCGPGIQSGVASCNTKEKFFAVFAVLTIDLRKNTQDLIVDPTEIDANLQSIKIDGMHVLPWFGEEMAINFVFDESSSKDVKLLESRLDKINELVSSVEKEDPWVKETFAVSGVGEGLVYYPISPDHKKYVVATNLFFKAKGEEHKTVAKTKPAQKDVPNVKGANAFANLVLTEHRLEQGVREINDGQFIFDIKNTGQFINWILNDIEKETLNELVQSNLDPSVVKKSCAQVARKWYISKCNSL